MDKKEFTTMDVIVHKATISLMSGETLEQFTQKLSDAGKEYLLSKLNMTKGNSWLVEVYRNKIVMAAYKDGEPSQFYAFKYSRDKSRNFQFSDTMEVERVTSFKPKSNVVMKNECCGDETKKALGEPITFSGWQETRKGFWMGVL